jgi:hypothetical protein
MNDLNILKIAGAFVAGVAGIIGILGQNRTQDNKLTRSGKWLFGMAIIGLVLALGTQIWEGRKFIEGDRAARQHNKELLERLDTEAHEIRRVVNRFQDKDISVDWSFSFGGTDEVFGPYIRDLAKLVEDAPFKPPFKVSDCFDAARDRGLTVNGYHPQLGVSDLRIDPDSPAMPDEVKYADLRHYILEAVPRIPLFKTPIEPKKFFTTWPHVRKSLDGPWDPLHDASRCDLIVNLQPGTGKVFIIVFLQKTGPKVSRIRVVHCGMAASISDSSGTVVSVDDLDGCQGIIDFFPRQRNLAKGWNTANNAYLGCRVNNQPITVSKLQPTQTGYGGKHDQLIYNFYTVQPC